MPQKMKSSIWNKEKVSFLTNTPPGLPLLYYHDSDTVSSVCSHAVHCICVCANQRAVLHVLSQQPVVIQRVLGFPRHSVHRSLVHLVLYCSEQHVERLPRWFLANNKDGRSTVSQHSRIQLKSHSTDVPIVNKVVLFRSTTKTKAVALNLERILSK